MTSLPPYVVVFIERDRLAEAGGHRHVTGIQTVDPDGGRTYWLLSQVVGAIRVGERFVLQAAEEERPTDLRIDTCPVCPELTLLSEELGPGARPER